MEEAGPAPAGRPAGITFLSVLLFVGMLVSFTAALSLLEPGTALESVWRINPVERESMEEMGGWAAPALLVVSGACALAGVGLWRRKAWGRRLAAGVLAVTLAEDFVSVFLRGDARALIGMPVVGALMIYLLSRRAKRSER